MAPRPSLPSSSKKRKASENDNSTSDENIIANLEQELIAAISSKSSLNPLADLLDIAQKTPNAQILSKAIYALYRVFVLIIGNGLLHVSKDEEAQAVKVWLQERLHSYVQLLVGLLKDEEQIIRTSSLKILFSLVKHHSSSFNKASSSSTGLRPQIYMPHFKQIVNGLLLCPPSPRGGLHSKRRKGVEDTSSLGQLEPDVRDLFIDTWLSECDDIRWFFFRDTATLLASYSHSEHPHVPVNLLSILERLTTFPTEAEELNKWWVEEFGARPPKLKSVTQDEDEEEEPEQEDSTNIEDDWRKYFDGDTADKEKKTNKKGVTGRLHKLSIHQSLHSLNSHRAVFTRAWLSLLPLLSVERSDDSKTLVTRALNVMHRGVMPHLTRAVLVMDWVASCVDYGEAVGLLALNALFILMKEYNLDYPSFYTRLYAFLDRNVLHLKHRARFFRLTELFLSSTHLPVALLASFIKRLARLSLNAPPAAIVMIIPFTYNILKKHPALMVMIHRVDDSYDATQDPFNDTEPNPTLTNALDSSLWELYSQKSHYHSAVSTLARVFEEAFTKPNYSLEDFLDHTYNTLYETEVKRRIKKDPAIAMELSQGSWFLPPSEDAQEIIKDKVDSLWVFS